MHGRQQLASYVKTQTKSHWTRSLLPQTARAHESRVDNTFELSARTWYTTTTTRRKNTYFSFEGPQCICQYNKSGQNMHNKAHFILLHFHYPLFQVVLFYKS